jgi:hypothetical protein
MLGPGETNIKIYEPFDRLRASATALRQARTLVFTRLIYMNVSPVYLRIFL